MGGFVSSNACFHPVTSAFGEQYNNHEAERSKSRQLCASATIYNYRFEIAQFQEYFG